jgi:hypothetical protein
VAVCVYAAAVPTSGFFLATALLTAVLSAWWGGYRWWVGALVGGLSAAAMFLVFDVLLGVPLPRGPWD